VNESTKIPFVCGSCFHWKEAKDMPVPTIGAAAVGICWGAPPTPRPVLDRHTGQQVGQANMRAITKATEPGCGLFIPAGADLGLQSSANDLNGVILQGR